MKKIAWAFLALLGLSSALSPVLTNTGTLRVSEIFYAEPYEGSQSLITTKLNYSISVRVLSQFENISRREGTQAQVAYWTPLLAFKINEDIYYQFPQIPNTFVSRPLRSADGRPDFNGWSASQKVHMHHITGSINIPAGNKAFQERIPQAVEVHFVRPVEMANLDNVMYKVQGDIAVRLHPVFIYN
jgi:hypothetical protein